MSKPHASSPRPRRTAPRPHRLALALAAGSLLTLPQAGAQVLPTGPVVAAGQAQIAVNGANMTVTNAANTIVNWNSFSIGAQNAVRFQQPDAASQVLNRVVGNDPSQILGQLSSNGKVWLLNPNGVLFGQNARIDVAGLVASTLRLNDQDWLAGRYAFGAGTPGAAVVNQGELRSTLGGRVVLLGGAVRNEGLIEAPGGQVLLAAGESMELVDTGAPHLTVRITAPQGEALNLGTLRASGGRIDVHAAVVNQQGLVQADALQAGPGGEIVLQASERLNLAEGSTTSATAANGQGGEIKLLGREVGLFGSARVDASGASGGGQVLVGGGLQGKDTSVPNADAVYFGRDAKISADATVRGDGGRIILWSDKATRAFGNLSARGGAQGGDGGFVETSGGWLDARPLAVDVAAPRGKAGQWLLDPYNITIISGVSGSGYDADFTANSDNAVIGAGTIVAALDAGTHVTVSTGGPAGSQPGTINMGGASIVANSVNPGSLTLIADADILMTSATIDSYGGGVLPVTLLAGRSGTGRIALSSTTVQTHGGDLTLGGYATGLTPDNVTFTGAASGGISISSSTLDAGAGRLQVHGVTADSTAGVSLSVFSNLTAADIGLRGQSAQGTGIGIDGGTLQATHTLTVEGTGETLGVQVGRARLYVTPAAPDPSAALLVAGRSQSDASAVQLESFLAQNSQLRVENGATLTVRGTNVPSGNGDPTVALYNADAYGGSLPPLLFSTNAGGAITVSAFGAGNDIRGEGTVASADASTVTMAADGALSLSGAQINAAGRIDVQARQIELSDATLTSSATGDAIVLRGPATNGPTGLDAFSNDDGDVGPNPGALSAVNGRWIIWGADIAQTAFNDGGLAYAFKRYGVTDLASWAGDSGNGYVFSAGKTASVNLFALDKVYDGSTQAQLSGGFATGYGSDSGSLRSDATAAFADKNAGTGKTVLLTSADPFAMFDSNGRPVYGYTFSGTGSAAITPARLTAAQVVAQSKVYDATTQASFNVGGLSGLVGSETVQVRGQGTFADKNVGNGKAVGNVQFTLSDGSNGGLASNYVFDAPDRSYAADITRMLLQINGLTAANKVYDATTAATLGGTAFVTALAGDRVDLTGVAFAQFSDKNVGTAKPVLLTGLGLAGADAGNYQLSSASLRADITPAQLLYVADAATRILGAPLSGFTGTVTGFVGGETQSGATTGTAGFSGPAAVAQTGLYAIDGGGLSAQNYVFAQAPGNATALQVLPARIDDGGARADVSVQAAVQSLDIAPLPRAQAVAGLADISLARSSTLPAASAASGSAADFGSVRLGSLSLGDLQALLDGRDRYKKTVFAESIAKLEQDPSLADMQPCSSMEQAASGSCLVTAELRAQAQAAPAATGTAAAPAAAPAAPATAAAPAAAAAAANVPALAPAPAPAQTLASRRRVQTASLPQIERKVALVIGVNRYDDASIPQLGNAVGDAQALGKLFESKLGYETVVLQNSSKAAVVAALNRLALELGPRDSALIYYAGHGELIESTGQGYWQLSDSDAKKPETWLSNADIARLLQQIGASQVALISDSCYSGSLAEGERIRATPGQADAGQLLSQKAVVAMSSGGNEPVFDEGKGGHSPFAWNLLNSLGQVNNWQPGGNVFERVRFAVARELPQRPRYGAGAGHQRGADYLFEQRQLEQGN